MSANKISNTAPKGLYSNYILLGHIFRMIPALLILVFFSCQQEPDISVKTPIEEICPTCSDNVSWDGLGQWEFNLMPSSNNGKYKFNIPINIQSDCGWALYTEENTGLLLGGGDYKVSSNECGSGVVLEWDNGLSAIYLAEGWIGTTHKGAKIGHTLTAFLVAHPEFEPSSSDTLSYRAIEGFRIIEAEFNSEKKLSKLIIQR